MSVHGLTGSDSAVSADRLLLPRKCAPRRRIEGLSWRKLEDAGAGGCSLGRLGVPGFMHSAVLEPKSGASHTNHCSMVTVDQLKGC